MAELTSFGYFSGDSLLHNLDPRFKLLFVILLSLVCLNLYFMALGISTFLLVGLIVYSRLPLNSGVKQLRYFFVLLLFVFMARVLSTGGESLIEVRFISVSRQGSIAGLMVCWRLALIVLMGFTLI